MMLKYKGELFGWLLFHRTSFKNLCKNFYFINEWQLCANRPNYRFLDEKICALLSKVTETITYLFHVYRGGCRNLSQEDLEF